MSPNSAPIALTDLKPHLIDIKYMDKFEPFNLSLPDGYSVRNFFVLILKYDRTNSVISEILQDKNDLKDVDLKLSQIVEKQTYVYLESLSRSIKEKNDGYWQGVDMLSVIADKKNDVIYVQLKHVNDDGFSFKD